MELTYYINKGFDNFESFYHYGKNSINEDEIYARQLCEYFIKDGKEYELESNELNGDTDSLIIKEKGAARRFSDEKNYKGLGVNIEFRKYQAYGDMELISVKHLNTHWEVIRYLLKDVIELPNQGQFLRDSAEIDEDRQVYVIYLSSL